MNDVVLTLAHPGAMFSAPDPDPLAPGFALGSGIERALSEVGARPVMRRREGRILLRFVGPERAEAAPMAAAVAAWCAARGEVLALQRAATWHEGLKTLWIAAIFIAVCVLLSAAGSAWLQGPGVLPMLARDSLVIAGWVALWRPIDMLLYETWLLRRDRRVLEAVAAMPVVVEPAGAHPAG